MSSDEFDNIPDEFDGIEDIDWTGLLSQRAHVETNISVPAARSPSAASTWSCIYDEMDSTFLAELDTLEQSNASTEAGPSQITVPVRNRPTNISQGSMSIPGSGLIPQSNSGTMIHVPQILSSDSRGPTSPPSHQRSSKQSVGRSGVTSSSKRTRSNTPSLEPPLLNKKGKHGKENGDMEQVLSTIEDELTCPICCDIFVATHVGNPCGHSVCGDCGWLWLKKNKDNGCAVCRAKMFKRKPLIPNIAIDNLVENHVRALGRNGDEDWLPNGAKFREWSARKEKWKEDLAQREKIKATVPRQKATGPFNFLDIVEMEVPQWIVPDDENDEDYINEHVGEPVPAAPRQRRRRNRTNRRNVA